ncbi:MAG: ribonuclease P protein component [Phycisphaerae bacterium]|nr:ribonuclease P protein component [Phycisphaerae bacterium]
MDRSAPKRFRVTRRNDIDRIFRAGRRANDARLTLLAAPNGLDRCRCGVGVSRRHGSAVRRNRAKRLCREAFRLSRAELPTGFDFMLVPRVGAELTLSGLQESLVRLAPRVARPAKEAAE